MQFNHAADHIQLFSNKAPITRFQEVSAYALCIAFRTIKLYFLLILFATLRDLFYKTYFFSLQIIRFLITYRNIEIYLPVSLKTFKGLCYSLFVSLIKTALWHLKPGTWNLFSGEIRFRVLAFGTLYKN